MIQEEMSGSSLSAGDWVEVRSKEEILQTLDKGGRLEGLPFMPQMLQYCGKRFQVYKRAHKTCDTVFPVRGRRMANAVHLETRRDGQAYGGCQAACLLFWKDAWLKKVEGGGNAKSELAARGKRNPGSECTEEDIWKGTRVGSTETESDPTYVCQATQLPYYTTELSSRDLRQYMEDYTSKNVTVGKMLAVGFYAAYNRIVNSRLGIGPFLCRLYDAFQSARGGVPYPRRRGPIPAGGKTPSSDLNLQVGELVRVKSYQEILETIDYNNNNRGLYFDAEMVPFCGKTYRVLKRVTQILNEKTGKMMRFKTACIILEDVFCKSCYSEKRFFCPRAIYSYWREIWLNRVESPAAGSYVKSQAGSGEGGKSESKAA